VPWLASGVSDYPVIGTDLYPTILDLVGEEQMPYQHRDGLSLKPILQGKELQDRPLYWHYPHYGNQGGQPNSIIQEDGWKLIYYWEDGRKELYNLNEDRSEQLNLAIKFPKITRDLNNKLIAWLADTQAEFPSKNPFYNKHQAKTRKNNLYALKGKCEKQRKAILDINFKPNQNWWGSQVTTRD